jgi:hypothetical protein
MKSLDVAILKSTFKENVGGMKLILPRIRSDVSLALIVYNLNQQ